VKRIATVVAAAATVAALVAGPGNAAPVKVVGTVGPGETIGLTIGGKKVKRLKAGIAYRFVIRDRSSEHDFRLSGPRTSKTLTSVGFTGTKSVVLKLKKGAYQFFCMPHADDMHGAFTVA
jgi:plastocyanin